MGFGQFEPHNTYAQPMADINTTPLIDVMLVLLVIFMLAAPLMTHSIQLDLPRAKATNGAPQPQPAITISIDPTGRFFWNDSLVGNAAELKARLTTLGREQPDTEIQLRADQHVRYALIATLLADAQDAGIRKIGFIVAPQHGPPAQPK